MNLLRSLALMSDTEATLCLQSMVRGLATTDNDFGDVVDDQSLIDQAMADAFERSVSGIKDIDDSKAVRALLVEVAEDPQMSPRLAGWVKDGRPRLEPITVGLVAAGVIFVLSIKGKVKFKKSKDGTVVDVQVERDATSADLLKKLLSIFTGG